MELLILKTNNCYKQSDSIMSNSKVNPPDLAEASCYQPSLKLVYTTI